jgi:hypothetical protein
LAVFLYSLDSVGFLFFEKSAKGILDFRTSSLLLVPFRVTADCPLPTACCVLGGEYGGECSPFRK